MIQAESTVMKECDQLSKAHETKTNSIHCSFFSIAALSNTAYDLYVGVARETSYITFLVSHLLGYYLGSSTPMKEADAAKECDGEDDDKVRCSFFLFMFAPVIYC